MGQSVVAGWVVLWWVMAVSAVSAGSGELPAYAVARLPTPVFSDPAFPKLFGGTDGRTLVRDRCGQLRSLEFIAPVGSVFSVRGAVPGSSPAIWQVTTTEYPYPAPGGYFVDHRFLIPAPAHPSERERSLPAREEILRRLRTSVGVPYVWGGNLRAGIPELRTLYPPSFPLSDAVSKTWTLAGLDCSGLLYEATGGVTPRNTSALVFYGTGVAIAGLDARGIAALLRPLDLIGWNGHVMIVIDGGQVIESRLKCGEPGNSGVAVRSLVRTLTELMATRSPVNEYRETAHDGRKSFVARRWYPE